MNTQSRHLTEGEVAELVDGRLTGPRLATAERHIVDCELCMVLVAAAGRALARSHAATAIASSRVANERTLLNWKTSILHHGTRIGRYKILEVVGEGGMGRVYAAIDPILDRQVALKLLHSSAATEAQKVRFEREAKAMARLSHPNVVIVYDAGRVGDQFFIAMEFVKGATLRDWLRIEQRAWRDVLTAFLHAGRGLSSAHDLGIVHRDFKPENVLVGDDGRVRVTDFGLARDTRKFLSNSHLTASAIAKASTAEARLTRPGAILGTPAYMAPEQYLGETATIKCDIYSFCLALYEALYQTRAFHRTDSDATRRETQTGSRFRLRGDGASTPAMLRRVLTKGLSADPDARHESMAELLEELEPALRRSNFGKTVAIAASTLTLLTALMLAYGAVPRHSSIPHQALTMAATTVTAPAVECTNNLSCVEKYRGQPYRCRLSDHTCVALATDDCHPSYDPSDLTHDGTVWIGAILPTKSTSYGAMHAHAIELAREEIAQQTSALRGPNASLQVPRLAVVVCDDRDPMLAARHLVEDVAVPAIMGFGSGQQVIDVAGSYLIERQVLTMSTLTTNSLITKLPQPPGLPRMVWTTVSTAETTALSTAAFIRGVLAPMTHSRHARIVLVHAEGTRTIPFAQRFHSEITRSGRPTLEDGADYYLEETFSSDPSENELSKIAARVGSAMPTIVVVLASDAVTVPLVEKLESKASAAARPIYVLPDAGTAALAGFIGANVDRRRRVFGTLPATNPEKEPHFVLRFNLAHPGEATLEANPAATYDGLYLLAYAVYAAGEKINGPRLAEALSNFVPPGHAIDTGPGDLFSAIALLSRGETIDPQGPSGSLDFDPNTGVIEKNYALVCPARGKSKTVTFDVESGVIFAANENRLKGNMHCP